MKAIKQITIMHDGHPMRDIADDVISMEFMKLQAQDKAEGKKELPPLEAYPILTTEYLIKRMIDIARYKSRSEQRRADEIYAKIKVTGDESDPVILLEDGELDFLNNIREKFPPYLSGRTFNPFHEVMENATPYPA